jgi:Virulence factor membrane-bound polymerase, C-terminal/O-Antigen ligase/Protein glycosylation ligase
MPICTTFVWLQYAFNLVSFGGDPLISTIYLAGLFFAIGVGMTWSSSEVVDGEELLITFMQAVWISALASGFIGLLQWFNLQVPWGMYVMQTDLGDRASGNLGQPNQLATLLLMGLAAQTYLFAKQKLGKTAFGAGVIILTLVLVLAQSRAALVSAILIACFACWKRNSMASPRPVRWVLVWISGFLLATFLLPVATDLLLMDGVRSMGFDGSSSVRIVMWKQILYAISESPWVGYGWNHTPTAHAAGAIAYPGTSTFTYSHNIMLDILAWCGLPLGLFIVGVSLYWVISRAVHATEPRAVYALAALVPILTHSMFEYPFAYSYFLLTAGIFIGVVEGATANLNVIVIRRFACTILMVLWIPFGCYLVYEYLLIEEDFRVVRFENLKIGKTPLDYTAPKIILLSHLGNMLQVARMRPMPNMNATDIEKLRKISKRFSYNTLNKRYILALALNGQTELARHELAVFKGIHGESIYNGVIQEMRDMRKTKYPSLGPLVD